MLEKIPSSVANLLKGRAVVITVHFCGRGKDRDKNRPKIYDAHSTAGEQNFGGTGHLPRVAFHRVFLLNDTK